MRQLILFLLGLFAIGSVLYGISAGVQLIQRGFAHLAKSASNDRLSKKPIIMPPPSTTETVSDSPAKPTGTAAHAPSTAQASPMQRRIDELRDIFTLYQQGALTREEFEGVKQCLLTDIRGAAPQAL